MLCKGAMKSYQHKVFDCKGAELQQGDNVRSLVAPHMTGVVKTIFADTTKEMVVNVYGTELLVNTDCWVKIDI